MTDSSLSPNLGSVSRDRARTSVPLERKLPLLIFGILSVVLAASVGLSYYEIRQAAEGSAAVRLSSVSGVLSSMMQQQTNSRLANMQRIAGDTAVASALRQPDRAPSPAALTALRVLAAPADSATPPLLLRPDGRPVGDVTLETPADAERVAGAVRPLLAAADSIHVGKLTAQSGYGSLWMAVPVRQHGELLGYIAQERRFGTNPRGLRPFRDLIGSDIEFYLRNANDDTWLDLAGAKVAPPTRAEKFQDSLTVYTHGSRGPALASTAAIKGSPLLITLEYPLRAVLARPLATTRALAIIAALLAVFGAAMAWLLSRRITRPLVDLTIAAEAIAHGDYRQHVNARGTDEIGRLGAAFNRMAERVEMSSTASAEAVARLTRSAATQEFLAEASQILARSLSDQTLLADLARACVPSIADYCTIHVVDDDGGIRRIETAHYDLSKQDAVRALVRRYEYRVDGPGEVSQVIRTQQPLLLPCLEPSLVRASARDETTARLIDQVGPRSFMCVPLVARGQALGAMSFTMTDSGRTLGPDDLDLAMELARRTAVAIDNSLIFRSSIALRIEAEAASSAKSDFLAKMSHEIRTPINAMIGYAELIQMGVSGATTEAQTKQLGRIRSSGEHLISLVDEILDLAKIEAGRMAVEPRVAVVGEAAESALALIRPQASRKGVDVGSAPDGDLTAPYVGDPQRVQQILANLLSNAIKFTPAGGRVSIDCGIAERTDETALDGVTEWARITVHDTGIGIAEDDVERIFQPFVQVESGYTRAHGGTGLGLTISRSLAQMMGGDLTVESLVGRGSEFTLWLPSPNSCNTPA